MREPDVIKALDDVSTFLSELPPDTSWAESRGNHTPELLLRPCGDKDMFLSAEDRTMF